jgi:hypothetical protein
MRRSFIVVVNRGGVVCAVASSGQNWVQPGAPGNPLFGLAGGNPVSPETASDGSYTQFGTKNDPMAGRRVGGTITFGGGLGLYTGSTRQKLAPEQAGASQL